MKTVFAPTYSRLDNDVVEFPRTDTSLRSSLFTFSDSTEHIAKSNMYVVRELVEYVSEIGETILDPMAGTGTILVGATIGRKILMIELEEQFQKTIGQNIRSVVRQFPQAEEDINLIPGDCSVVLPIPVDHLIFSPPYANLFKGKKAGDKSIVEHYRNTAGYAMNPNSIANLSEFLYHQRMELVYRKCFSSLNPGGTMTIIIKDRTINGVRQELGKRAAADCQKLGFKLAAWNRWNAKGGWFSDYNRSIGLETVQEEELITLQKPTRAEADYNTAAKERIKLAADYAYTASRLRA